MRVCVFYYNAYLSGPVQWGELAAGLHLLVGHIDEREIAAARLDVAPWKGLAAATRRCLGYLERALRFWRLGDARSSVNQAPRARNVVQAAAGWFGRANSTGVVDGSHM